MHPPFARGAPRLPGRRLELHLENSDPPYLVLLGLVGRDLWGQGRPASG